MGRPVTTAPSLREARHAKRCTLRPGDLKTAITCTFWQLPPLQRLSTLLLLRSQYSQEWRTSMRKAFRRNGVVALALLVGCGGNTTVQNSWKDPTAPSRQFSKVLNVFLSSESNTRRSAEDEMSRRIPGSVSSYTVLPDSVLNSTAQAKA